MYAERRHLTNTMLAYYPVELVANKPWVLFVSVKDQANST